MSKLSSIQRDGEIVSDAPIGSPETKPENIATMLAVALDHVRQGRPVFPCDWRADTKKPGRPSKKPLINAWPEKATTDPAQIKAWWKQWPKALVGIPTGAASGIAVLDTDIEIDPVTGEVIKDGEAVLQAELKARGWTLPDYLLEVRTARGGLHRWFQHEAGFKCSTNVIPGVDTRAEGGFIIAPGSQGAVGGAWEFKDGCDLVAREEEAPTWLAHAFRTGKWPGADGEAVRSKAEPGGSAEPLDELDQLDSTKPDDIRKALAEHWDADSYDDWTTAALALHRHPEGRELWEEWSSQSAKYDPADADKKWAQTKPKKNITARTILYRVPAAKLSAWGRATSSGADGGDIGNAKAFAVRFTGEFACLFPAKVYVRWTGSRWAACEQGEEIEAAKQLAQEIADDAAARYTETGSKFDGARLNAAMALKNNRTRLDNMLVLAKSDPLLAVHQRDFDNDPWLLGVQNGVVELRTGQLIAPNPRQRILRQAGAIFDPTTKYPRWLKFLADIQPDAEIRAFLQRAVGYTLTGLPDEERIFFLHGNGANGKSVFATVLARLFGDYHCTITPAALSKSRYGSGNEADRAIARLPGARLALANETAQGSIWDDQRLKELASRDPIAARKLYAEAFDFTPTHKLWIRGNHLPGAHDAGDGFWRRLIVIPFTVQLAEADRVTDLDRQLIDSELSGILAWAVEGCQAWQKQGLNVPQSLQSRIDQYRTETDLLGQWVEECLLEDAHGKATVASAYSSFQMFCREQGVSTPSKRQFISDLAERKIETSKAAKGKRVFKGFRVIESSIFDDLTSEP